jgi:hypothetical protein
LWRNLLGQIQQQSPTPSSNTNNIELSIETNSNPHENLQNPQNIRNAAQILIQQSINPTATTNNNNHWGHRLGQKLPGTFRVGLRNINSLPTYTRHSKNNLLIQNIEEGGFDVFCATEIYVGWHNVSSEEYPANRFRGKLELAKYTTSNNKDKEYKEKHQSGGTMMVCKGDICARTVESGREEGILGRWTWVKLRGCKVPQYTVQLTHRVQ